ncbi:MAG: hypothetical protein J4F98_05840 [Acidobacteria bacterium]|nr:hypothetical protein [Acidobacteriota bacterium]
MDLQRTQDSALTRADVDRIGAALDASIAPNTAKAYRAALGAFRRFLAGRKATDETAAAYVAALMDAGKAPATIRLHAAAIGAGARAAGEDDPRGPLTTQALRGAVRANAGLGRGQVAGLGRENAVAAAAAAVAEGSTAGLRDAVLLRVMSDALLRPSEVAAIDAGDVSREADGSGRLVVPRSKTDQEAEGAVAYLTPATMTVLGRWLEAAAEGSYAGPLFRRVTRTGQVTGRAALSTDRAQAGRGRRRRRSQRTQLPGGQRAVPHRARSVNRRGGDRRALEGPRHGGPLRQGPGGRPGSGEGVLRGQVDAAEMVSSFSGWRR